MPVHDDLGLRMKSNYEMRARSYLTRRTPVIIRIDGKAFHSFTKGFKKPYDKLLMTCMQETMKYLCEHIQGCVLGYTQSDEISLLLIDYKKLTSDSWFDYQVQKICSISASMATMQFNRIFNDSMCGISPRIQGRYSLEEFENNIEEFKLEEPDIYSDLEKYDLLNYLDPEDPSKYRELEDLCDAYWKANEKGAMFDARCFNIPPEEVTNYFFWRQEDATRNSIQMAGQAYFSHKQLMNKSCNMIQDMLHEEKGINWNDYPTDFKRGSCCIKLRFTQKTIMENGQPCDKTAYRNRWIIEHDIPRFVNEARDYIDSLLLPEVEE